MLLLSTMMTIKAIKLPPYECEKVDGVKETIAVLLVVTTVAPRAKSLALESIGGERCER